MNSMNKIKKSFLAVLLLGFFVGCHQSISLENTTWILTGLLDGETGKLMTPSQLVKDTNEQTPLTLSFDQTQVSGFSGVNNFFAPFETKENALKMSNIASTRKSGSPDMMNRETLFYETLIQVSHYSIKKNTLYLSDNRGVVLLTFTQNELEGTQWILIGYFDGTALTTPIHLKEAFIEFGKDNSVSGSNGVNRYFGSYTIAEKQKITFSQLGSTLIIGTEEEMMESDQFNQLLGQTTSYSISGNKLSLKDDEKTILLSFEQKY